jgi:hypothetical protein
MDVAEYQRAQDIFDAVVELAPGPRAAAVEAACAGDVGLKALVMELLGHDEQNTGGGLSGLLGGEVVNEALGPRPLEPGLDVDRYRVLRLLGVGGTARVWEVRHHTLGSRHALKVLTWADPRLQRRLLREARTQARLVHPNVVPVHDVLQVHGAPGLLMPLIEGPPLDELLAAHRPSTPEALGVFRGVCAGVAHAHAAGLAHRDLKPSNVLLALQDDRVVPRVVDFGLVKGTGQQTMTRPGMVLGTLGYAAPEQLVDTASAGERADVWALGIMLYELLAGERPFRGGDLVQVMAAQQEGPPMGPIPDALRPLVAGMLQVEASGRPADAGAVLAALPETPALTLGGSLGRAAQALREERFSVEVGLELLDPPSLLSEPQDGATWHAQEPVSTAAAEVVAAGRRSRRVTGVVGILIAASVGLFLLSRSFGPLAGADGPGEAPAAAEMVHADPPGRDQAASDRASVDDPAKEAAGTENPSVEAGAPDPLAPGPELEPELGPDPEADVPVLAAVVPEPRSDRMPVEAALAAVAPEPEAVPAEVAAVPPEVAAVAPEAAAVAPEAAAVAPAMIIVQGGPSEQRLVSKDGRIVAPGLVPAGAYRFEARMEKRGNWVNLDLGDLAPGSTTRIACDHAFGYCKVARP